MLRYEIENKRHLVAAVYEFGITENKWQLVERHQNCISVEWKKVQQVKLPINNSVNSFLSRKI